MMMTNYFHYYQKTIHKIAMNANEAIKPQTHKNWRKTAKTHKTIIHLAMIVAKSRENRV